MTRAIVFPGQGSQTVGMGKDLADAFPAARAVFEEVDDALDQKLSTLMFEGPEDELTLTENTQPALLAVSLAVVRSIEAESGKRPADYASFAAGHSLGEYSALAATGTFSLGDAARLLRIRGNAMQKAVPVGDGAMAALIGIEAEDAVAIAEAAAAGDVCDFANDNAPGQVVLSGAVGAIERAVEIAKERGAKRAVLLPVSAPFHCALMGPAADVMAEALANTEMHDPAIPIVANVSAAPVETADVARRLLVEQVCGRVRWRECVQTMANEGVRELVELGHGKVLTGLTRRIDRELSGTAVGSSETVREFAAALS